MNGDIILEALRQCQRASNVISLFIIKFSLHTSRITTKVKGKKPGNTQLFCNKI